MSGDSDIMRILGNIEGKLDGLVNSQSSVQGQVTIIGKDLQDHKAEDALIKNRIVGAGVVLTVLWTVITFFSDFYFKMTGGSSQ